MLHLVSWHLALLIRTPGSGAMECFSWLASEVMSCALQLEADLKVPAKHKAMLEELTRLRREHVKWNNQTDTLTKCAIITCLCDLPCIPAMLI